MLRALPVCAVLLALAPAARTGEKPKPAERPSPPVWEPIRMTVYPATAPKPASELKKSSSIFASPEDLDAMIAAARARKGGQEPTLGEVWTEIFDAIGRVLDKAIEQKRGGSGIGRGNTEERSTTRPSAIAPHSSAIVRL